MVGFTTEMADQHFSLRTLLVVPLVQHGLLDQPEVRVGQDLQEERERRGQQSQRVHCRGPSYPVLSTPV
jgi:hypothetical protein